MWKKLFVIIGVSIFYGFVLFSCQTPRENLSSNSPKPFSSEENSPCPDKTAPFSSYDSALEEYEIDGKPQPGSQHDPPDWWCQKYQEEKEKNLSLEHPIFQLSQDYPSELPEHVEQPWKNFDFKDKSQWKDYLRAALRYSYEGNIEVNWTVQENKIGRKWYHAPWMHYDVRGREFVHGMTNERCSCENELIPKKDKVTGELKVEGCPTYPSGNKEVLCHPSTPIQNWAISAYNAPGGYFLKKIWYEVKSPEPNITEFERLTSEGFPEGTVAIKLLFTKADPKKVEYLKNSIVWKADINRVKANPKGAVEDLRLLQIDLAIRDNRSPVGWVFGTFIYNDKAVPFLSNFPVPKGQEGWLRVEPIGVMFGNDVGKFFDSQLSETIINNELEIKPHLGCGKRLNGAVDNSTSSCISCHALSETPRNLKISSLPHTSMRCDNPCDIGYWMKNINPRSKKLPEKTFADCSSDKKVFSLGTCQEKPLPSLGERIYSLDYSLQLREGIKRYCSSNSENCAKWEIKPTTATKPLIENKVTQVTREGITVTQEP